MDPTGGVNPSSSVTPDYMQSMGYAGAAQSPPPFMQPTPISMPSAQPAAANPYVSQSNYAVATPTQDQFYPRTPSADSRPDWQKQIVAEVNAAQVYAPAAPSQGTTPQAEVFNQNPMQISQNPYQMLSYAPQPQSQAVAPSQYQTPSPVQAPIWQQSPQYSTDHQVPMGDIVIPLDDTPASSRRWVGILIILVVAGVVLGGIGFGAYTLGSKAGHTKATDEYKKTLQQQALNDTQNNDQQTQDTTEDPALDFSLITPEYKNESVTGGIGEQLQAADGFILYVKNVERNFSTNQNPEVGKEYIKVNFLVGNASQTIPAKITNANFTLKTAAGEVITADESLTSYEGKVDSLSLNPGSKGRMSVVFGVESGASSLTLVRQQSYVSKSLGTTVVSKIEVALGS